MSSELLVEIGVKNIALLKNVKVNFQEGFNVITGETGAGKSILIESLKLALGEKVPPLLVPSSDEGHVEIIYDRSVMKQEIASLKGSEFEKDEELVMKRKISPSGRSRIYLNDESVTGRFLGELTAELVNILGQHAYEKLFGARNATKLVDSYAGNGEAFREYTRLYREWRRVLKELELTGEKAPRLKEKLDFVGNAIKEIKGLDLQDDEITSIEAELPALKNAAKIKEAVTEALDLVEQGEINSLSLLDGAIERLENVSNFLPSLDNLLNRLKEQFYLINDMARDLGNCLSGIDLDENRYDELVERLSTLKRLGRKYGVEPEFLHLKLSELIDEKEGLSRQSKSIEEMESKEREMAGHLQSLSAELSDRRKGSRKKFESDVMAELNDLGLQHSRFMISFQKESAGLTMYGAEKVEFLFSPADSVEAGPLTAIASGGELSRVMLAVHNAVTAKDMFGTLVFDEVDSGIGGKMADLVGDKLKKLSHSCQVICITHLPQIAALADNHVKIMKKKEKKGPHVFAKSLTSEERVGEIARMVSGEEITSEAREYAKKLLGQV